MERKFKIGDKVKIVKINDEVNGRANKYLNQIAVVTGYWEECYKLDVDNHAFEWYEDELELVKESIFDKLAHSIAEVAKEANILVEPTEDGGIKISPLGKKEEDLGIGTPCMVSDDGNEWGLSFYAGNKRTFSDGFKWKKSSNTFTWVYIIEFSKFNPNNIEESLKYNIVK